MRTYEEILAGKPSDVEEAVFDIATGVATPFKEAYYGIKQAVTDLTPEEEDTVRRMRAEREEAGGWGTVGEVGSWVLPGGALARGAMRAAQQAPRLVRALSVPAAEGALVGGYEAARPVLEGDPTRSERGQMGAATAAAGAAVGELGGHVLRRALTGITDVSPEAARLQQRMRAQGVDPSMTLGQQSGENVSSVEQKMAFMPFTGLQRDRTDAMKRWNQTLFNEARPRNPVTGEPIGNVTEGGTRGFDQLSRIYDDLYRRGTDGVTMTASQVFRDAADQMRRDVQQNVRTQANVDAVTDNINRWMNQVAEGKASGSAIKEIETEIREAAQAAQRSTDFGMADAYRDFGRLFRQQRDHAAGMRRALLLESADAGYGDVVDLQDAMAHLGAQRQDVFTPDQLQAARSKQLTKRQRARGRALEGYEDADRVFGTTVPAVGPGTAEKLTTVGMLGGAGIDPSLVLFPLTASAYGAASRSPAAIRHLTGQYAYQPALRRALERIQPYGTAAAAAYPEHE